MKKTFLIRCFILLVLTAGISCTNRDSAKSKDDHPGKFPEMVRASHEGGSSSAYFYYVNNLDNADTLLSVSSPAAALTQVHESFESKEGLKGMKQLDKVIIQAGDTMKFAHGGIHVMLMQLNQNLDTGDTVRVDLNLALAGPVSKFIPVKIN